MPRNTTAASKTAKRGAPRKPARDAVRLLTEDHKKVKKMFDEFEKIKDKQDISEQKQLLVETACAELTIHTQLEEELFYPAVRDAIDETDLLDEAKVEHDVARQLITELSAMQPDDDLYDAKFIVLGEYIRHHIQEEEKQLFPKVRKADLDLAELADEMDERRLELRDELGFTAEDEEEEDETRAEARRHLH